MAQPRLQDSPWSASDFEKQKILSEKLQMELIMEEDVERQKRQASKVGKKFMSKQTLKNLKEPQSTKPEATVETKMPHDFEECFRNICGLSVQDCMDPITISHPERADSAKDPTLAVAESLVDVQNTSSPDLSRHEALNITAAAVVTTTLGSQNSQHPPSQGAQVDCSAKSTVQGLADCGLPPASLISIARPSRPLQKGKPSARTARSNGSENSGGDDQVSADIPAQTANQAIASEQSEDPMVSQAEAHDAPVKEVILTAETAAERGESQRSTGNGARRRAYRPPKAPGQLAAAAAVAGRIDAPEISEAAAPAEPIAVGAEPNRADADDRLPPSHPLASVLRDCDTSSPAGYGGGHYEILSGTHTPGAPTSCYHVGGGGSSGASIPMFWPGSMSEWVVPRCDPAQGTGRYPPRGFGPPWLAASNFGPWPGLAQTACPPPLGAVHPAAADAAVAACTPWPGPGYLADPYGAGPAMWLPVHLFLPPPLHGPSG